MELSQVVNEEGKAKALAAATSELERLFKKEDFKEMKVAYLCYIHMNFIQYKKASTIFNTRNTEMLVPVHDYFLP